MHFVPCLCQAGQEGTEHLSAAALPRSCYTVLLARVQTPLTDSRFPAEPEVTGGHAGTSAWFSLHVGGLVARERIQLHELYSTAV